jgi:hypothetical protein
MPTKKPTYDELKNIVQRVYQSQKRVNNNKSLPSPAFKNMVRMMFDKNKIDYRKGKGKKWYMSLTTEFASRGGNKSKGPSKN